MNRGVAHVLMHFRVSLSCDTCRILPESQGIARLQHQRGIQTFKAAESEGPDKEKDESQGGDHTHHLAHCPEMLGDAIKFSRKQQLDHWTHSTDISAAAKLHWLIN